MAKVSGPLFSANASGKFAGKLVFGSWKGRATVRNLVTPANPQSADQVATRNAIRCLGAGQKFANTTALKRSGETITDKASLTAAAPSGQAWNGYLVKSAIGAMLVTYDAAAAIYTALQSNEKTAWVNAAGALTPAIPAVAQMAAGGGAGTPLTAGQVFFHYVYGLYAAGLVTAVPGATPPTYA
jgi:hypothetical protein